MAKRETNKTQAPTIWESPAAVWPMVQTILDEPSPPKPKGHRRVDLRRILHGLIFRLRTGCQWNRRPGVLGDDRPVHRHFQHWCQQGSFECLWAVLVEACDELHGVDWPWQAADTAMGKARLGGDLGGRHPTDRGKQGEHAAWGARRRQARWVRPSPGRTSMTPSYGPPPSRPSW